MTRFETVTTPPTLGAGRQYSYVYLHIPAPAAVNNFNSMDRIAGRPGWQAAASAWNNITTGAPPAPTGSVIYNGRVAVRLTSTSAPTGTQLSPNFAVVARPFVMTFQEARAAGLSGQYIDDAWCWSFSAVCAFDAIPGAITGDVGIAIGQGNRTEIRGVAALAGMELGPTGVGTIGVICRQADGGGVTLAQNLAGVADMTVFHKYEIRILGPTTTSEASVKFLIDGQPQLILPYGAGTVLPSQLGSTNGLGFTPGIVNLRATAAGTVGMYIAHDSVNCCCAPEEAALP